MSTEYRGFRGEGFPAGIDEIVAIFGEMGFAVAEGPHIEEDFYNFAVLNISPEHPARLCHGNRKEDALGARARTGQLSCGCDLSRSSLEVAGVFALVARDLLGKQPLASIPLATRIASATVEAFEQR